MTRLLSPEEAELLRDSETRHAITFAVAMAFVLVGALIFGGVWSAVVLPDWAWLVTVAIFAVGGAGIMLFLILGFRRGRRHIADVVDMWREWVAQEIKAKALPTETTPLPLPTETRVIPVTAGNRVGEVVVYVNGFHPEFIKWWAGYLADGNPTSETRLEKMRLPYQGGLFGGLTDGTPLTRLLDLCEKRGILSPRDKARRKPGALLIQDEAEITKLLFFEDKNP